MGKQPLSLTLLLGAWRVLLMLCVCFGAGAGAYAEVVPLAIDPSATRVDLSKVTLLLEDSAGTLTLDDVRKSELGTLFAAKPIHIAAKPLWLRWTVTNSGTADLTRWFDSGNRTLQEIDFFAPNEQGVYQRISTGSRKRFGERPLPTNTFVFPLTLSAGKTVDLYMRVRSTGYFPGAVVPKVLTVEAFRAEAGIENSRFYAALSFMAALIFVNIFLYYFNRDRNNLLYVLSVASYMLGACSVNGGFGPAFAHFWPDSPIFEQSVWVAAIWAAGVFPGLFTLNLIDLPQRRPRVVRWIKISWLLMTGAILFQSVGTMLQLRDMGQALQMGYLVGAIPFVTSNSLMTYGILAEAWAGNRSARIVMLGFVPIIFLMVVQAFMNLMNGVLLVNPLYLASIFEMLVMAAAVADRFKQTRLQANRERAQAQTALIEGLKQSERELESKVAQRTEQLANSEAKAKDLLYNMLPEEIADELSTTGTTQPVRHESASIFFTDFSGFTQAASTMPADRMVAELNEVFAAFDDICDDVGVEKIKTIGDAYMAAAGLPKPCADHAQRCVRAGLRMVAYLHDRNTHSAFKWSLRVGIHSGPVVAGVVGKRKYAFDIWGDTVNIASRMESAGEPGRVNVSAYTYDLIRSEFDCEYRGKVDAKGKGQIDMYFVTRQSERTGNPT